MPIFNSPESPGEPAGRQVNGIPPIRRRGTTVRMRVLSSACVLVLLLAASLFIYAKIRIAREALPLSPAERNMALTVFARLHADLGEPYPGAPDLRVRQWAGDPAGSGDGEGAFDESIPSVEALAADIAARCAILVAADTGEVLFEKNADERIPPASMTKLAAMYTAFRALGSGEISLEDRVDLPPESWAENIPPGSSLMFLGPRQRVTVEELLLGMAIVSGNDAAIALAHHVSHSVPSFVERMNGEMKRIGLIHTRFVEPSGLSEYNMTTAREFADFSLVYLNDYPEALTRFHSRTVFEYPRPYNLPDGTYRAGTTIAQRATNRLLDLLPGCDGLKTGYIIESGYNISLTAKRGDTRYLAVLMGGPGANAREGNELRIRDGTLLIEWAFANFRLLRLEDIKGISLTVWGGTDPALVAIPAGNASLTIPAALADRIAADGIIPTPVVPSSLEAPVQAGDMLGTLEYRSGNLVVHSIPLVADRSVRQGTPVYRAVEYAARFVSELVSERPVSGYRP